MPRTVETVVYEIEELSEAAKEHARAWYRETCLDHDWHDAVFEDFETICTILGVTLRTSPVRLVGGGTRDKPQIYWSGNAENRTMPRSLPNALISPEAAPALSA